MNESEPDAAVVPIVVIKISHAEKCNTARLSF